MADPRPSSIQKPPAYLTRYLSNWTNPAWLSGDKWRSVVRQVPGAIICRDRLIAYVEGTPWAITAKDSAQQTELQKEIDVHTEIINDWGGDGFISGVSLLWQDALDLPAGGNVEVVRWEDGRLFAIFHMDGATLAATGDPKMPIYQQDPNDFTHKIFFPSDKVARVGCAPRPELARRGWFMAPPERVYLALVLLWRGDKYYANLLLDTPPAGLLSLGDMSKQSAEEWLGSFRELMSGIDAMKVPVLYEIKETSPQWIPFGRPPTEMIFDKATLRYLQVVCAAYGISLQDIGIGEAQRSLAGAIRSERESQKAGFAFVKTSTESLINGILPPTLRFQFLLQDEESLIQKGRSRLANAQAMRHLVEAGILKEEDAQKQLKLDGLLTVDTNGEVGERFGRQTEAQVHPTDVLETHKPATHGGHGEITKAGYSLEEELAELETLLEEEFADLQAQMTDSRIQRLIKAKARGQDLDDHLDADQWWLLGISTVALAAILERVARRGASAVAESIQNILYVEGLVNSPVAPPILEITSHLMLAQLQERAADAVRLVDDGTKYYLKQILSRSVTEGLARRDIVDRIAAGDSLETILADGKFTAEVMKQVRLDVGEMSKQRIRSITDFEISKANNLARLEAMSRAGLETKAWKHMVAAGTGVDCPCPICEANEALGFVSLSYQYETVFEPAPGPPAHPTVCHCDLVFDSAEVIAKAGQINIWTGGD